eukprot:TRINITY_DN14116_c0_g5_i1.p1 TRINITY_DN14116_c0_g5~~TRINITY_DN14116_c0_g5_i1.p1  ORF type:complete len:333 (-),score=32.80 TRINITY_DN14116_c0_g5_i1:53-1051(-)
MHERREVNSSDSIHPVTIAHFDQISKESERDNTPTEFLVEKLKQEIRILQNIVDFVIEQLKERDLQLIQAAQKYAELEQCCLDSITKEQREKENSLNMPLDRDIRAELPRPYYSKEPNSSNMWSLFERTKEYKDCMDNMSCVVRKDSRRQRNEFEYILEHEVGKTARVASVAGSTWSLHGVNKGLANEDIVDANSSFLHKDILQRIKERLIRSYGTSVIYREENLLDLMSTVEFTSEISENHRTLICMINTLNKYNELLRKLLTQNISIRGRNKAERYCELLKKNSSLKANIRHLLEQQNGSNNLEEYLAIMSDLLIRENDKLLFDVDQLLV